MFQTIFFSEVSGIASESDCLMCPAGKYSNATGQTSLADCVCCDPGWYQDATGQSECIICPEGNRCPVATQPPIPCGIGTHQFYQGQTNCTSCDAGRYQDATGQTECTICPDGRYGLNPGDTTPNCYGECSALSPIFYCNNALREYCPGDFGTFCYAGVRIH